MYTIKTNLGDITIKLDEENAPKTSANFKQYVADGFYENTIFHRVIDSFMIQGGGLTEEMETKSTKQPVENEAKQAKPNKRGTIAMARTSNPHSATAQFFINLVDNDFLNFTSEDMQGYGYCVFGEVVDGMDVVDKIAKVKTGVHMGHADVPKETIVIETIESADI
ncbi:peptidylprolyl isomerase [Legionella sp. W05-934-2]|uniref:peptidylprolyl isomerase n=1 Tax=Legionella sp. W05-934-2 TaxID=1198649 RepID=UPI00346315A4